MKITVVPVMKKIMIVKKYLRQKKSSRIIYWKITTNSEINILKNTILGNIKFIIKNAYLGN